MTKKDYVLIANAIYRARVTNLGSAHKRAIDVITQAITDSLQSDNGRFDRERFLAACGVS